MKKIFVISALMALFIPSVANAGDGQATIAMPFVAVNTDPASAAMGSISLFHNSASYMLTDKMGHAQVNYLRWQPTTSNFIGGEFAMKIKDIVGVRASVTDNMETAYDICDEFGDVTGQYKPNALKAEFGVAAKFAKYFSVGVEGVYARRTLAEDYGYNSFGANAAFMASVKGFTAAVGGKNLCAPVKLEDGSKFNLPSSAFLDAGYVATIKDTHVITVGAEFEYFFSNVLAYGAGLKYEYKVVSVAAGYHGGGYMPDHVSAGLGLNIKGVTLNATALIGVGGAAKTTGTVVAGIGYAF